MNKMRVLSIKKKFSRFFLIFLIIFVSIQLNSEVLAVNVNSINSFFVNRQILDELNVDNYGGFENFEGELKSNVKVTFHAIKSLNSLSHLGGINKEAVIEYLSSRQLLDTGYELEAGIGISYIIPTSLAVLSFYILDSTDWIDSGTINWIVSRQILNESDTPNHGGFEKKVNDSVASITSTYHALNSLNMSNNLNSINVTAVSSWLANRQLSDGSFEDISGAGTSSIKISSYAIISLKILDKLDLINQSKIINYLISKQNLNISKSGYGGFSNSPPSIQSTVEDTNHALRALKELNSLDGINKTACSTFLTERQLSNGGFESYPNLGFPSTSDSYFATESLLILGYNFNDGFNPTNFNPFFILLILIMIISSVSSSIGIYVFYHKKSKKIKIKQKKMKRKTK